MNEPRSGEQAQRLGLSRHAYVGAPALRSAPRLDNVDRRTPAHWSFDPKGQRRLRDALRAERSAMLDAI